MARLAKVLEGHDGLESANATLQGNVTLVYDDERTSRDALLEGDAARRLPRSKNRASGCSGNPAAAGSSLESRC